MEKNSELKMNSKERCLAALYDNAVDRVPLFPLLMYLAADRLGVSFKEFATNGHVMAEAQLNACSLFELDAITACSDAFRMAADLGADMEYPDELPPHSPPLIQSESELKSLKRPDPLTRGSRMADRTHGVREMTAAVGGEVLVLGWVDLPFAEACSICGVQEFLMMLITEPVFAHAILEFLTPIVIDFCMVQLDVGAPMIGCGDAAASLISPDMYREFALPYEQRVFESIHNAGGFGKLHICGNTSGFLSDMVLSGADLFNVDHMVDFGAACKVFGNAGKCYKGNLDPVNDVMKQTPEDCLEKSLELIARAEPFPYMLSAGCEIPKDVSNETFLAFCNAPRCDPVIQA